MKSVLVFFRLSRPYFFLAAVLMYALGTGMARYLGAPVDWGVYLLGQAWIITLQLGAHYLGEFYGLPSPGPEEEPELDPSSAPSTLTRSAALLASAASLSVTASLSVLLIRSANHSPIVIGVMLLILIGAAFYSLPRLRGSGYGELVLSVLISNLVPILAFLLQNRHDYAGSLPGLVAMSTFPLTSLHLAMLLNLELPGYAVDLRRQTQNLLIRMGWQIGMVVHNVLILVAFVLLGLATALGMPLGIALPALLLLPLGLLQIWVINRIAGGASPQWKLLNVTAVLLFGAMAALLTFTYWTR